MKKIIFLLIIAATIIFTSVLFISRTVANASSASSTNAPQATTTPTFTSTPTQTGVPCPIATPELLSVVYDSYTGDLTETVNVTLNNSDSITVTGPLDIYTSNGSGSFEVELVADSINDILVEGHVRLIEYGNGCTYGNYTLSKAIQIVQDSSATPTATPTSTQCPIPTPARPYVSFDSPTADLSPIINVHLFNADAITVTGELDTYTANGSGPIEIDLIADAVNVIRVDAHAAAGTAPCSLGEYTTSTTVEIVHDSSSTPTPTPTPTPFSEPTIVYPRLIRVQPNPVIPGESIEVDGTDGYLLYEDGSTDDSERFFSLMLDGAPISTTMRCDTLACEAHLIVPEDIALGEHTIEVEGGSTVEFVYELDGGMLLTPTPTVTPDVTPTPGCPVDTFEHDGICYPSPWTGEQQYGCFPTIGGPEICIDPPPPTGTPTTTLTPALGCPADTYEHDGVCYPNPWTGEQQYGCFPTVDGLTICIDPAPPTDMPTSTPTPEPGCPADTFEHDGVCYPSPWTGEAQYGCFPTVDGLTICIDPAEPTTPTPGTPTITPTSTPTLTPCAMPTALPQPSINDALFLSPTDALLATITIEGRYLVDNLKLSGPMGEYSPTSQSYDRAEFDVALIANSSNIFTVLKRLNTVTVDDSCQHNVSYNWVTALQIEIVQSNDSDPSTPTPTFTPTATPSPEATVVYPSLNSVSPNPVAAGESVEIIGSGGYLYYANNGFYDESSRNFELFFDGDLVSTIGCYVNYCRTEFVLPADAITGTHQFSATGGSTIEIDVTAGAEPTAPTITVNHAEGAPGSVFLIEGSGFAPEEVIQIAITGMSAPLSIQADPSGAFTLLLMTNDLASGIYELSVPTSSNGTDILGGEAISVVLDSAHPRRDRPVDLATNIEEVLIAGSGDPMNNAKVYLPFLQAR